MYVDILYNTYVYTYTYAIFHGSDKGRIYYSEIIHINEALITCLHISE